MDLFTSDPRGRPEPTPLVRIAFTREQLWELISNYEKSFASGSEGNELADLVADKLNRALRSLDNRRK